MVEVLISCTSVSCVDSPGRGHKHAMQAIQLLASIYDRFNQAIDLFFDLVERSCAQSRTLGIMQNNSARCADVSATRMMQNYDQMLLKLISKHWNAVGLLGNWDVYHALERIKALQDVYEVRERSKATIFSLFKRNDAASLFCETRRVLRRIQKERVSEMVTAATESRGWTPRMLVARRSSSHLRVERISQGSSSSRKNSVFVTVQKAPDDCFAALEPKGMHQNPTHVDAFFIPEMDTTSLYTIAEKAESEVVDIERFSDFEFFVGSTGGSAHSSFETTRFEGDSRARAYLPKVRT